MARKASSKPDSGTSQSSATIGKTVDEGMVAIERHRTRLKGMLPKGYASPALAESRTGFQPVPSGDNELKTRSTSHRSVDLLGRVYDWSGATKTAAGSPQGERGGVHQYFLTRFASAEGKNGGAAKCEVRNASVEWKTSRRFVIPRSIRHSTFGFRHSPLLALRGIETDFGLVHADTFRRGLHPDLRADYVLANPPFNDSDWFPQGRLCALHMLRRHLADELGIAA